MVTASVDKTARREVLEDAARIIERRAAGASHLIRVPGQQRLCADLAHDDRWCSTCAGMEAGMDYAAGMLREMAAGGAE